ncbi:MAG: hypothetical protein A2583_02745 [Bdellovibrionales bacterium RIFOXYD1_FULL_53_11]|nr:MAG: hypothetical protein A2583_02745 [Bdellovibrionales bacterium RIFOXYD1_FULL_53_11]
MRLPVITLRAVHGFQVVEKPEVNRLWNGQSVQESQNLCLKVAFRNVGLSASIILALLAAMVVGVKRAEAIHMMRSRNR